MRPASPQRRRRSSDIVQQPWMQFHNPLPPIDLLTTDQVEALHQAALTILENIGVCCGLSEAQRVLAKAGALVDSTSGLIKIGRSAISNVNADYRFGIIQAGSKRKWSGFRINSKAKSDI